MNKSYGVAFRLGALVMAGGSLAGCLNQVLHSAITAGVEASSTPESVGVSTSTWRGKSCKELEFSHGYMAEDQRKSAASGDSFSAKTSGWQMDAINQVRTEQGCIAGAGGVKVPANGQVIAYGYCYDADDKHQYLTPVFTYGDYYSDSGAAESEAFRAMLKSTYGSNGNGVCLMEDSPTKAQAAIEHKASLTKLQFRDNVRVAWTPPPMVKAHKDSVAATSATVPGKTTTTTPIASSHLDALTLGLTLETPSPELVKALGLTDNSGAWVVSVTPGSAADNAGIKPMDVIRDLSGQMVTAPNDVQTIAGKLRAGYKAPLGVWRDRSNHELILTITSGPSPSVATTNTVAVAPAARSAAAQPPAAAGKLYCHAYVFVEKQPGGFQSPIIERAGESQDPAVMMASLSAFVTKVRQQQPDQWRPFSFPLEQCSSPTGFCFANTESSLFKVKQSAAQFCFLTRAEAETDLQKFNTFTPVYQVVN